MTGRLEGQVAIVTGASRGIGRAIAQAYAAEGAKVAVLGRTVDGLHETVRLCAGLPGTALAFALAGAGVAGCWQPARTPALKTTSPSMNRIISPYQEFKRSVCDYAHGLGPESSGHPGISGPCYAYPKFISAYLTTAKS